MREMVENWSLPWQRLQRSLAEAFGADAEMAPRAKAESPNLKRNRSASPPVSWLVRARGGVPQIYQAGS